MTEAEIDALQAEIITADIEKKCLESRLKRLNSDFEHRRYLRLGTSAQIIRETMEVRTLLRSAQRRLLKAEMAVVAAKRDRGAIG